MVRFDLCFLGTISVLLCYFFARFSLQYAIVVLVLVGLAICKRNGCFAYKLKWGNLVMVYCLGEKW